MDVRSWYELTVTMPLCIREAARADLNGIVAIERASFSDAWTRGMFASSMAAGAGNIFLVAEDDAHVAGYAMAQSVRDESELLNIAVSPERRHRGIGSMLLDAIIDRCRRSGALEMWLEVRASNAGARTLYETRGFVAVGVRKRYYDAPREDAIVLRADFRGLARDETVTVPEPGLTAGRADSILSPASHFPRQETR
jgi:[ribosomal protein S18]-alanine N-acetyltransferase